MIEYDITRFCNKTHDEIIDIDNWEGMVEYLAERKGIPVENFEASEIVAEEIVIEHAFLKNEYNRDGELIYTGVKIITITYTTETGGIGELPLIAHFENEDAGEVDDTWLYEQAMTNADTISNYNVLFDQLASKNFKLLKDNEVFEVNEKTLDKVWVDMGAERVDLDYKIKQENLNIQSGQWFGDYEVIGEEEAKEYEED